MPPALPFETDAALVEWLRAQGLSHVLRLSLGVVALKVDAFQPHVRAVTARRRLSELLSAESVERWTSQTLPSSHLRELLPALAATFLEEERAAAAEARATLPERLLPPPDARSHAAHALLLALRQRFPAEVAPRPPRALGKLQPDELLPGFRLRETRCSELPLGAQEGFILPEARLAFSPGEAKVTCTCGALFCVHGLAAVDAALLWLRQRFTPAFAEALSNLTRPAWERTLRALDTALQDGPAGEVSWSLEFPEGSAAVVPVVQRRGKEPVVLSRRKLLEEALSEEDARVAALLPDFEGAASQALLLQLCGHPRVTFEGEPVRVERATVGLVAEERGKDVVVSAGLDGAALPPALLERVRASQAGEALYDWDEGARRLTVLEAGAPVRALLAALHKHGSSFPPESRGALIEKLSTLSAKLPVALPRSVMGEAAPPADLPVVRLEAQPGGAVRAELRVRTLRDSPSFAPGEGARDVHVRRGVNAVHAVRDFAREVAVARALKAQLPLVAAEPGDSPFVFEFRDAQGALALLSACQALEPAPELEWIGSPLTLAGHRGPATLRVWLEKKRNWFGLLGSLSVLGERVELARLIEAARRKERFVRVDATSYVEIEAALLQHLQALADHVHASPHGLEVGPSAAETLAGLARAGAEVEADRAWQELSARILASAALQPLLPAGLKADLRGYQREGFEWLMRLASWGAGGVLADDMGLGKTVQALSVLLARSPLGPALVVAPLSVGFNWLDEAKRFAPSLKFLLLADEADRPAALEKLGPGDVVVLSHGLLVREVQRLSALRFATLVFDEAQVLKNSGTHRFRAARALQADFRVALSGTPIENHLGELWSLFALVFPALLGSWESFRSRYAAPIQNRKDTEAAPALSRVLQPFLLRRTKAQVATQLPPRTEVRVQVVLSPEEWALYEDARLAALSDLETPKRKMREQERRVEVLAALTRLRLLASHPRLHDPQSKVASSKLLRFMELCDELRAEGHRALVFSQFTSHLALVRELLDQRGLAYEYLDGQTPPAERAARVHAFQEGTAPLFLLSLKAGGLGLNLTAATSVIHLDPWWNPAVEDQASDRAHRLGQERPVTIYRLVARGTIEEQMLELHETKRALVAAVLEGKDVAGKLSTEDLLALLSQPKAV